ncbi:MAG: aspartate-semialdehyde dehydrogenase [Pseudomonadota bacterium]
MSSDHPFDPQGFIVAIVGGTGAVGREMIAILAERGFPAKKVIPLASHRSVGQQISYGDEATLTAQDLATYDFAGTDIVLSSAGANVSKTFAPRATEAGAVVIDNTSLFRMEPDVPLVVPEVNPGAIADYHKRGIIANGNCSTIPLSLALAPLHKLVPIRRVVVATYQSVSGSGKGAMDELFEQTRAVYVNDTMKKSFMTKQIAFNVIPHIDVFLDDGQTKEEWKMQSEIRKILSPDIALIATCVRVPVFISHASAITIEFTGPIDLKDARRALENAPGVSVFDKREDGGYVTPIDCAGEDDVYISRLRVDPSCENGLALWCVSDNLRKGAALNSVQIAELLARDHLKTPAHLQDKKPSAQLA